MSTFPDAIDQFLSVVREHKTLQELQESHGRVSSASSSRDRQ